MGRRCCCGCPVCTVDTRLPICCPCVCLSICVTFTPNAWNAYEAENRPACEADNQECRPQSIEIDWDDYEQAYIGSIAGHDLYYSFYRNEYDGKCYFYLESETLGRHEWEVKETDDQCYGREHECVECLDLTTALGVEGNEYDECSAGVLTTECVVWVTPTTCNSCLCLCECVCVFVTMDSISYSGKACWDDYQNLYIGEVSGYDQYNICRTRTVKLPIDRWGDVCDPNVEPEEPTACEPIHVMDDTDYGCTYTGEWSTDALQGYGGSMRYAEGGGGDNKIEWTFTGLPKGRWKASATWVAGDGRASNAPYTILDGTRLAGFVRLNQSNSPDDFTYDGTDWERLGTFTIKGDTLTVRLTDAANGAVYADAIHLEYIDDRCAIGLMISAEEGEIGEVEGWIHGEWQLMTEPCELRNMNYAWFIDREPYNSDDDIMVSIRCATCNEECDEEFALECCPGLSLPGTLTVSFDVPWKTSDEPEEWIWTTHSMELVYDPDKQLWIGKLFVSPPEESIESIDKGVGMTFGGSIINGGIHCRLGWVGMIAPGFTIPSTQGAWDTWESDPVEHDSFVEYPTAGWTIVDLDDWPNPLQKFPDGDCNPNSLIMMCDPFALYICSPAVEGLGSYPVNVLVTL